MYVNHASKCLGGGRVSGEVYCREASLLPKGTPHSCEIGINLDSCGDQRGSLDKRLLFLGFKVIIKSL